MRGLAHAPIDGTKVAEGSEDNSDGGTITGDKSVD